MSTQKSPRSRAAYSPIVAGLHPEALVRLPQILGDPRADPPLVGVFPGGKSTFYKLIRSGVMPEPIKPLPGGKGSYWVLGRVLDAIRKLEAKANGESYTPPSVKARRERQMARRGSQ